MAYAWLKSIFAKPPIGPRKINDPSVRGQREALGTTELSRRQWTKLHVYQDDVTEAIRTSDMGNMYLAASLMRSAMTDSILAGLMNTRSSGLVRLAKTFTGDAELAAELAKGTTALYDDSQSLFDTLSPPSELEAVVSDFIGLGVCVGTLEQTTEPTIKTLVRQDPAGLRQDLRTGAWVYDSTVGALEIEPGDGNWFFLAAGKTQPWRRGQFNCLGRSYVRKLHAIFHKANYEATIANSAKVLTTPNGATDEHRSCAVEQVSEWGDNSTFALTAGWQIQLLESQGKGVESFDKTIEDVNNEYKYAIQGQVGTSDGAAGFSNIAPLAAIRTDLIEANSQALAHAVNTQVLLPYAYARTRTVEKRVFVAWSTKPAADQNREATALVTAATAIKSLSEVLIGTAEPLDIDVMCERFNVPRTKAHASLDSTTTLMAGPQVTSLLQTLQMAAQNQIPRDTAIAVIVAAFAKTQQEAETLLGTIGNGFTPTSLEGPAI